MLLLGRDANNGKKTRLFWLPTLTCVGSKDYDAAGILSGAKKKVSRCRHHFDRFSFRLILEMHFSASRYICVAEASSYEILFLLFFV